MTKILILEEIFYKDEKFVDNKGNKINPKPVGTPIILNINLDDFNKYRDEKLRARLSRLQTKYQRINAYIQGQTLPGIITQDTSFQFYKK